VSDVRLEAGMVALRRVGEELSTSARTARDIEQTVRL
jgi:hypothetical protein